MSKYQKVVEGVIAELSSLPLETKIFQLDMVVDQLRRELIHLRNLVLPTGRKLLVGSRPYRVVTYLAQNDDPVSMKDIRIAIDGDAPEKTCIVKSHLDDLMAGAVVVRHPAPKECNPTKWLFSLEPAVKTYVRKHLEDES